MADAPSRKRKVPLRPWLRALHRDAGYFVVGLTFIYAISGLAVNHIEDWDPSFHQVERTHAVPGPYPADDRLVARKVLGVLEIDDEPTEVYRASDAELEIVLDGRTLHLDQAKGEVFEEGQEPRVFFRLANWLHLNRGKKAWTAIADGYAILLLFLASSGLFMIPGRKGLRGRGAIIVGLGVAVPVLYVVLSGGP